MSDKLHLFAYSSILSKIKVTENIMPSTFESTFEPISVSIFRLVYPLLANLRISYNLYVISVLLLYCSFSSAYILSKYIFIFFIFSGLLVNSVGAGIDAMLPFFWFFCYGASVKFFSSNSLTNAVSLNFLKIY